MNSGRALPLGWVSRDGKIIILARSVRTFAQGSIAVLFAVYLDMLGFTLTQIGVFFSFGVAGAALFAFLVSLISEKVGRRRLMVVLTLVTAAAGAALVLTNDIVILTAFAFIGTLSGVGGGRRRPADSASGAGQPGGRGPRRQADGPVCRLRHRLHGRGCRRARWPPAFPRSTRATLGSARYTHSRRCSWPL